MEDYTEEEFGRFIPGQQSEDVDMQDAIPAAAGPSLLQCKPTGTTPHRVDDVMEQTSDSQPMPTIEQQSDNDMSSRYIIAVDFGTTFSSVAFVCIDPETPQQHVRAEFVTCINKYPNMPPITDANILAKSTTVPTELLYSIVDASKTPEACSLSDSSDHETSSIVSLDEIWASSSAEDSEQDVDDIQVPPPENERFADRGLSAWGWGVHSKLLKPESTLDFYHLTNFKLHLDRDSNSAAELRRDSMAVMKSLKGLKTKDLIAIYLGNLFKHVKSQLTASYGFHGQSPVEFVLCVPAAWDWQACQVMQDALDTAVKTSRFLALEHDTIPDIFIVAEPEAALAYVLDTDQSASEMVCGESLLIIDAGGGTVDFTVCTLTRTNPPRYKEAVKPDGVSSGSSFLNRRLRALLKDRLGSATIVENGVPLASIIDAKVIEFETVKRGINILKKDATFEVYIPGLQADEEKRFRTNKMDINWREMYRVFSDSLRDIANMMQEQLKAAKNGEVNVQTVVLIGGFGQSPSLYTHLKKVLRKEKNYLKRSIQLIRPELVESAVARGAVMRALRKEGGPARISRSSYGLLWTVPFDKEDQNHRRFRVWRDPADGQLCIKDTICWFLDKVCVLNSFSKTFSQIKNLRGRPSMQGKRS